MRRLLPIWSWTVSLKRCWNEVNSSHLPWKYLAGPRSIRREWCWDFIKKMMSHKGKETTIPFFIDAKKSKRFYDHLCRKRSQRPQKNKTEALEKSNHKSDLLLFWFYYWGSNSDRTSPSSVVLSKSSPIWVIQSKLCFKRIVYVNSFKIPMIYRMFLCWWICW